MVLVPARLIVFLSGMSVLGAAMAAETIPPGGKSLLSENALAGLKLHGPQKQLATVQTLDVANQPFAKALRVVTRPGASVEWNVQLLTPLDATIQNGDVLLGRFWLRCAESMTGDGFAGFVVELGKDDFPKSVEQRVAAGSEWRECLIPFTAKRDYAPGEARLCIRVGYDRQTIEIGGLELLNFGQSVKLADLPRTKITYAGREADAKWRSDAQDRIEKIRKGDLTVRVTDESGKPIAGAQVHATLKRHAFGFGSCVTVNQLLGDSPDDKRCQEIIEKYFNLAVFENDMKWPAIYESIPAKTDKALAWLLERGIKVRGHNLVWPSWKWLPQQLQAYKNDPNELRRRTAEHITQAVSHFRGKLYQWDVVNEDFANHDLMDVLGGRDVMIDWFKLAHQADPDCKLYLNDYSILDGPPSNRHRRHFYDTIKWLKESGAPIHGIGIQSHFSSDLPPPVQLLKVLDQFTQLGLPIESTELSLNIEDRPLQADYLRDYMIALFSHENVNGIMLWGFWEGRHWRPQAALFAKDWSPRPAWQAWVDLVHEQWKTDTKTTTDGQGIARVQGFCGEYDVQVSANGKSQAGQASLSRGGAELTLVMK